MNIELKDLKVRIEAVRDKIKSLPKKQKLMLGTLLALIFFSLYLNLFYKPNVLRMRAIKRNIGTYISKIDHLKTQKPPVAIEKKSLEALEQDMGRLDKKIKKLESELPSENKLPQILGEIIAKAANYNVRFAAIIPEYSKEKKDIYSSLEVEIQFYAEYDDFANYVKNLEKNPEFFYVKEIELEETKDSHENLLATIVLASLVIDREDQKSSKPDDTVITEEDVDIERSPFTSKHKPLPKNLKDEDKEIVLSGVALMGARSTAIINNNFYKIGDVIDNKTITEIRRNSVLLTDGTEEYILTTEKNNKDTDNNEEGEQK